MESDTCAPSAERGGSVAKLFCARCAADLDSAGTPCDPAACALRQLVQCRNLMREKDSELVGLRARVLELEGRINTPHTHDWFEAVRLEAAHQVERWGTKHDEGKAPQDWFWLLGYLGGKALASALLGDDEKAKHHTISSGAMLLNWFRQLNGESNELRPGIADPEVDRG